MKGRPAPERTILIEGQPLSEILDEETIHAVVHSFYDLIRKDDALGPIFDDAIDADAWPDHLSKMCDFWSSVLLRTGRYTGHPLRPHLALREIEEVHFRRWLALFHETVYRLCRPDVAAVFMDRALRIAHSFRLAIAFHRGGDALQVMPIREGDYVEGDWKSPSRSVWND